MGSQPDLNFNTPEERAYARTTDPKTSHAAAKSVEGESAKRIAGMVADLLESQKPNGFTTHEMADRLKIDLVSISPRMAPLEKKGLVVRSPERRGRAGSKVKSIVWKAAP